MLTCYCPDYAGVGCPSTFPWENLPPELKHEILAMVPLLRLAQLAVLCKGFKAVYRKRQQNVEALLPLPDLPAFPPKFWDGLFFGLKAAYMGRVDRITPHDTLYVWGWWDLYPGGILRCQDHTKVAVKVEAAYDGPSTSCMATVGLRCVVGETSLWPSVLSTEMILDCSESPAGAPPTFGILVGLKAARAARTFFEGLAGSNKGVASVNVGLVSNNEGLAGNNAGGVPQTVPLERVSVVLPEGSSWPDGPEGEHTCDAVTTILAIAGGRPSGVRISVKGTEGVLPWRLPCVLGGQSV
jgi:hypothetical protein